jgi:type IV secretory pathway TraG/TraD family ATPase VirD4
MENQEWDLDEPLLTFSSKFEESYFRARDSFTNTLITGSLGSGKTSGSARTLILSMLQKKFGGIVFTTKPSDKDDFLELCRLTGREKDVICFEPSSPYSFNFIEWESKNSGVGLTENIINLLKEIIKISDDKESGKSEDSFWSDSLDNLIANVLHLCKLAHDKITIPLVYEIVLSIPTNKEDLKKTPDKESESAFHKAFRLARANVREKVEKWEKSLPKKKRTLLSGDRKLYWDEVINNVQDARQLRMSDTYFANTWMNLAEKTRSIIYMQFSNFLGKFLQEPFYSMFCKHESNFTPNDCLDGKLIILNLPVKIHGKVGRDLQLAFKLIAQKSWEKRDVEQNGRPVFMLMDEFQNFLVETDFNFYCTCRSSRIANICITQNISNLYASMGGQKARDKVNSILGVYSNYFFHANTHTETNNYASELIGEAYYEEKTTGVTVGQDVANTTGKSHKLQKMVLPQDFQRLKNGGKLNDYKVEAYFFRQGEPFFNGHNFLKVTFDQNFKP